MSTSLDAVLLLKRFHLILEVLSLVSLARSIRRAVLLRIDVVERAVDAFQRAYDMFFVSVLRPIRPSNRTLLIVEVARGCDSCVA